MNVSGNHISVVNSFTIITRPKSNRFPENLIAMFAI